MKFRIKPLLATIAAAVPLLALSQAAPWPSKPKRDFELNAELVKAAGIEPH